MTKKILCLLFAVAVCVSLLAGCAPAEKPEETAPSQGEAPAEPTEQAPQEAEPPADEGESELPEATEADFPVFDGEIQRVGTDEVGYVDVPADWLPFKDLSGSGTYQYSDPTGSYIVSLDSGARVGIDDAQAWAGNILRLMEDYGSENFEGAKMTFLGNPCYQCYGAFPDDTVWVVSIFTLEDGTVRYLSVEGPVADEFGPIYGLAITSYGISE